MKEIKMLDKMEKERKGENFVGTQPVTWQEKHLSPNQMENGASVQQGRCLHPNGTGGLLSHSF